MSEHRIEPASKKGESSDEPHVPGWHGTPELRLLIKGYIDRIKNHENFNAIIANSTAVHLAYISTPEIRQLHESRHDVYKRTGELIPEIVDFYSSHAHEVDTRDVVQYIRNSMQLKSYFETNIINARLEGKQVPQETLDQYKALVDGDFRHDVLVYVPTMGYTKVKPHVIFKLTIEAPVDEFSNAKLQEMVQLSMEHVLDRFMEEVTLSCMKEGGSISIPLNRYCLLEAERKEPKIIIPVLNVLDHLVLSADQGGEEIILTNKIYAISFDPNFNPLTGTIVL